MIRLIFILLLLSTNIIYADTPQSPAFYIVNGNLYRWDDGISTTLRETGHDFGIVLSSNGEHIALTSMADHMVEAGGPPIAQDIVTDIWLLDVQSQSFTQLTQQPPDSTVNSGIKRSQSVFSPDSTQLAWWEIDYVGDELMLQYDNQRIVIYDMLDQTYTTIPIDEEAIPRGYSDSRGYKFEQLYWGDGIVYAPRSRSNDENTLNIIMIDPVTQSITHTAYLNAGRIDFQAWVKLADTEWALGFTQDDQYFAHNPTSDTWWAVDGFPQVRLVNEPESAIRVSLFTDSNEIEVTNTADHQSYRIWDPFSHLRQNKRFSLSPDGQHFIGYIRQRDTSDTTIQIWHPDNTYIQVIAAEDHELGSDLPEVVWGAMEQMLPTHLTLTEVQPPFDSK